MSRYAAAALVKDGGSHRGGRKRTRALTLGATLVVAFVVALVANAWASTTTYTVTPDWLGNANSPTLIPDTTPSSPAPYDDEVLAAAASADGGATAAWINTNEGISVSSLDPATGVWGAASSPHGVDAEPNTNGNGGPNDAPTVSVAMDAAGDAVVAWWTGTTTQDVDYMYEPAGGSWSTPTVLNAPDANLVDSVQVVMNSSGDAALAVGYTAASGSSVELATGSMTGGTLSFGTPAALDQPANGTSAEMPQIAIDGAGDVLSTWIESFSSGNPGAYASFEPAGASTPSTATPVGSSDMTLSEGGPTVAMNASGEAAIAWPNVSGPGYVIQETDATLTQLETAGGPVFDSPGTVAPDISANAGQPDDSEVFPSIALSDDGTTALVWNDDQTLNVDAIIRPAADLGTTNWSSTDDLQANSTACSASVCSEPTPVVAPQVAFEQGDNAVVLWSGTTNGVYSVTSQGDSFAGLTSAASQLEAGSATNTAGNEPWNETELSLATDGVGDAVATWINNNTSGETQPVDDEMDGAGTSFGIPATATLNTPVTFTASNPWTWETPTTSWTGQGGLSGTGDSVNNTYTAPGTYTVTATTSDGSGGSGADDVVNGTITVPQLSQSISFSPTGSGTVGGSETLSASAPGGSVTFSVDPSTSPADACSVSGTNGTGLAFAHAGSCVIDANQAGDTDYSAAAPTSQTVTVGKGSQSISFPAPAGGTVGGSETLTATGGGSGNPVVFSVDPSSGSDACSVSGTNGTTLSFSQAASCVIDANQAGNSDYSAAPQVSRAVTVAAAPNTTTSTPTTSTPTTSTPSTSTTPAPVLGQSADVSKTSGTIRVELPGTDTFVTVSSAQQIPFGAIINATSGTVTATIALPGGGTSTATFWAGEFTLSQSPSGALKATLVDGSTAGCPASEKAAKHSGHVRAGHDLGLGKATKKKKPGAVVGSLWTSAKGSYSTSGKNGSAAVLGTEWLTRDQCDGTYFEVLKTSNDPHGEIKVTVFHPHRHTVLLKRGHSLLAPAPGFS